MNLITPLKDLEIERIDWFRSSLKNWSNNNFRSYPWRETRDAYAIFVAEFMLQKTAADTVVPVYRSFLGKYPNITSLASASIAEIAEILQPLGLFFRAERLSRAARIILDKYDAIVSSSEQELLKLPGIGKYTARSICANAYGQSKAVLDTNVARILERFFGIQGEKIKSRCKILWRAAEQVAPDRDVSRWNLTLLDFGAKVCTASKPKCELCPLAKECDFFNK
ncbi:MAG: A/G-specific adenine glycosylase [Prochloraceae cyanobacterium]|nr:A/G-specific adenine glycosylase [Prochloraceae cyanobacterium]